MEPLFVWSSFLLVSALYVSPVTLAQSPVLRVASAANDFLLTLDANQRKSVLFAFDDETQRARWSNFPVGMVPRGGLSLKEMTASQRSAALRVVASALSDQGYAKVQQIMEADEADKDADGHGRPPPRRPPLLPPDAADLPSGRVGPTRPRFDGPPPFGGRRPAGGPQYGRDLYYLSFLGAPSAKTPWMLQFGGHHLALNITFVAERGVLTPSLTGAQPALYIHDGVTVRPLGAESDKALALLTALDSTQRQQAVLGSRIADLVLGPGQDGRMIEPEGLKASAMTAHQRVLLLAVIAEWAGIIDDTDARLRMSQLAADIEDTWFLWSGEISGTAGQNIKAYYRIQGPHLVIEYAPQHDDPAMHVHTMYRDPTNDYGRARPIP